MARIRIVEAWLRCPAAPPTHRRAVMVVAEAWAEQRVLMRAYAASPDQTRPTIALHGAHHAIGPAGIDPHGPWGIHVEPPADGRAQALQGALEVAARRLFGSKGSPPRLADEEDSFERKHTGYWAPGTPPDLPSSSSHAQPGYFEPSEAASPWPPAGTPPAPPGPLGPHAPTLWLEPGQPGTTPATAPGDWPVPGHHAAPPSGPPSPPQAGHAPAAEAPAATVPGFAPGAGARLEDRDMGTSETPGHRPALLGRTMPLGLRLTAIEHQVLNALGEARSLTAARVAQIAGTANGAAWMEALMAKLAGCGLDLIAPVTGPDGEAMYVLRG